MADSDVFEIIIKGLLDEFSAYRTAEEAARLALHESLSAGDGLRASLADRELSEQRFAARLAAVDICDKLLSSQYFN